MLAGLEHLFGEDHAYLVNGRDDNSDGYVDNGFDGVDNDGNGLIDDLPEWETETWDSTLAQGLAAATYSITRRPVPSARGAVQILPVSVVIDLTTWPTTRERSRVMVDLYTGQVDILLNPNGTLVPMTLFSSPSSVGMSEAFVHLWLTDRSGIWNPFSPGNAFSLPMPSGTTGYPAGLPTLDGHRLLVTLSARTGRIAVNPLESFDAGNTSLPFTYAQQQ